MSSPTTNEYGPIPQALSMDPLKETGNSQSLLREYYCNETFHLGKYRNLAASLVYTHACVVTKRIGEDKKRVFFGKIQSVAEFLGLNPRTIRRGIKVLVDIGFFVPLKTGRRTRGGHFTSNKYEVLFHTEWAKTHPGECCIKRPDSEED